MADQYDLVVIGSGPGGQRAAIQAAKLGKRVAVVEKSDQLGGAALRAGTIPSKALREAALIPHRDGRHPSAGRPPASPA